jgi:hypothetical protein
MNDYRAASQELQDQVRAAARKGQERVTKHVKSVTAAAAQIRPQLASLSKPAINISALPGSAQLRERAPELASKLPTKLQPKLPTKLPSPDQLRAGAQELAGHARTVRRLVTDQVMSVATPLAHQAAARLAQVGTAAEPEAKTTTRVSEVTVTKDEKPAGPEPTTPKPATARTSTAKPSTAKAGSTAKPTTAKTGTTRKPKAEPAGK